MTDHLQRSLAMGMAPETQEKKRHCPVSGQKKKGMTDNSNNYPVRTANR